jgi:hypothetical protein
MWIMLFHVMHALVGGSTYFSSRHVATFLKNLIIDYSIQSEKSKCVSLKTVISLTRRS